MVIHTSPKDFYFARAQNLRHLYTKTTGSFVSPRIYKGITILKIAMQRNSHISTLATRLDTYIGKSHTSLKEISEKADIPAFTLMRFTIGSGLLTEKYANSLIETLDELEKGLSQTNTQPRKGNHDG